MAVKSLNKVMLIGNLTRDPEIKYTGTGTAVASFSLATNKSWKDSSGATQDSTQYHNIVAWTKLAEICGQYLKKGMKVYVEGELITRSWQADDGQTKYRTEVRINDMIMLDGKGRSDGASSESAKADSDNSFDDMAADGGADTSGDPLSDEDLPF
jgi:single-strand DNA-binding protein